MKFMWMMLTDLYVGLRHGRMHCQHYSYSIMTDPHPVCIDCGHKLKHVTYVHGERTVK